MKSVMRNKQKLFALSLIFYIIMISITQLPSSIITANEDITTNYPFIYKQSDTHKMKIYDFSHYNRPIYPNYTIVSLEVEFESEQLTLADLEASYTHNLINWTTVEMIELRELTDNSSIFAANLGPFKYSGSYVLNVTAIRGNIELIIIISNFSLNFDFNIESCNGS